MRFAVPRTELIKRGPTNTSDPRHVSEREPRGQGVWHQPGDPIHIVIRLAQSLGACSAGCFQLAYVERPDVRAAFLGSCEFAVLSLRHSTSVSPPTRTVKHLTSNVRLEITG